MTRNDQIKDKVCLFNRVVERCFKSTSRSINWNAASPNVPIPYEDGKLVIAKRIPAPLAILFASNDLPRSFLSFFSLFFVSVIILLLETFFVNEFATFNSVFAIFAVFAISFLFIFTTKALKSFENFSMSACQLFVFFI